MDAWLIYKLTGATDGGVFVTDVSNAARTNLMDIRSQQWHPETCSYFSLEADMLPEIKSNAEVFGYVKEGPLQGMALPKGSLSRHHDKPPKLACCAEAWFAVSHTHVTATASPGLTCAYAMSSAEMCWTRTRVTDSFHICCRLHVIARIAVSHHKRFCMPTLCLPGCGCGYTLAWCNILIML